MSDTITKFNVKVQTKIKQVEARPETLKASGAARAEHADNGIRSHFTTLEASAQTAKLATGNFLAAANVNQKPSGVTVLRLGP